MNSFSAITRKMLSCSDWSALCSEELHHHNGILVNYCWKSAFIPSPFDFWLGVQFYLQNGACRVLQTSPNDAQCTGQKQARANSRVLRYQQRATMPGIVMVAATSRTASRTCAGMSLPLAHCDSLGACRRRFLPFIWNCNL